MTSLLSRLAAGAAVLGAASFTPAITLGQIDTFQDGTVMSWSGGAAPTNIATGGPAGAGDRFLRITASTPGGPGSRIGTHNNAQWGGNFALAGVTVIEVDMRNEGAVPLEMRLVLMGQAATQWVSNNANVLPPDNQWHRVTFLIMESQMTQTVGAETFQAVVGNLDRMMFRHDAGAPGNGGTQVTSQLGIDNIEALSAATVAPTAYAKLTGNHLSGGLAEILRSDNLYIHATVDLSAEITNPISYLFETTSPLSDPSQLRFSIESGGDADGRGEYIELYNFAENRWEFIQSQSLNSSDRVATVTITNNAARFIHPTTLTTRARLTWFEDSSEINQLLAIRIDRVWWNISP